MSNTCILVINCGSSSLKFAAINPVSTIAKISGIIENINTEDSKCIWTYKHQEHQQQLEYTNYEKALKQIVKLLTQYDLIDSISSIGHRVVHGGENFTQSVLITDYVLAIIETCIPLAPLHNPAQLSGIKAAQQLFPNLPNIAVFDTAFHQTIPPEAFIYSIPYEMYEKHAVRRYGFHGTSYRYISQIAHQQLQLNINNSCLLVAHLGNGASACAIKNGQSIDTTMGLTPLEGLTMGTRSGDIDPNIFTFLHNMLDYSLQDTTDMLNKQSGLLGLSGINSDCRAIELAANEGNRQATLALKIFCHALVKKLASLAVQMDRIDALVFTGGIGENSIFIRQKVIEKMGIFGFKLNTELNQQMIKKNQGIITQKDSTIAIVIPTNEELMVAQDAYTLTSLKKTPSRL